MSRPKNIAANVIAKTTVDNQPVKIGDVVLVDEPTFANLSAKGRLELASPEEAAKAKAAAAAAAEKAAQAEADEAPAAQESAPQPVRRGRREPATP